MNLLAFAAQGAWLGSSLGAYAAFRRALRHPARAQDSWLRRHLRRHGGSRYGRAHACDRVTSYAEFTRSVPLVGYDELEPWIDRIRAGDTHVLSVDPVSRLMPTSGSSGARKLIPYTPSLQRDFNAAIGPWIVDLWASHPSLLTGPAYWSVTPLPELAPEASAVPIGFADDSEYLGGLRARLVAAAMAVPAGTRRLRDLVQFRRSVLLHLLRCADLRLISVWHPSFLTLLLDALSADWDSLLAEIGPTVPAARRQTLRAADPRKLRQVWPGLRVVSCWADANAAGPAAALQERLPGVHVQPKGLLATEAFSTVPFAGGHPLALRSHFFEFIAENGAILRAEDLRPGAGYEIVVTTSGGLWRYRTGDRVEVDGFIERTPSLRFVGRLGGVSDRRGEKLSDAFVARVIAEVCPDASFALLAPEEASGRSHYTLFLRPLAHPAPDAPRLDAALQANPHYALCRRLGQLDEARVVRIAADAYERYVAAEMARGMRLGDIKPIALSPRTDWAEKFGERSDPALVQPSTPSSSCKF